METGTDQRPDQQCLKSCGRSQLRHLRQVRHGATDKQRPNPIIKIRLPHKESKQLLELLWSGLSFHLLEVHELAEVLSSRDV
jgi:hypothetical protein